MPYFIAENFGDCKGWAVVDAAGDAFGCHQTKQGAIDQAIAISLSDDEPFEGDWSNRKAGGPKIKISDIDDTLIHAGGRVEKVWAFLQDAEGELFLVTGRPESARDETVSMLENAGVTYSRLIMNPGSTSGSVAYKKAAAEELLKSYDVTVAVENNVSALRAYRALGIDAVNPSDIRDNRNMDIRAVAGELSEGDWVRWISGDEVEYGQVVAVDGDSVQVQCWDEEDGVWSVCDEVVLVELVRLEKIDALPAPEVDPNAGMMREVSRNVEMRFSPLGFEIREEADGMRFSGYAAVFNSPSEPLPFTERIAPGAFKRSLRARNDIKLLWNHDTGQVLGSTRAKTVSLVEDDKGLRVEALLPNTSLGRDTAELLRRGDVDSMSFGFTVPSGGDVWNADGTERTLRSIRLHEISIVSFPAYSATAGTTSVRSMAKAAQRANVDADQLTAALIKLENGEELAVDERTILNTTIDALSPNLKLEHDAGDSSLTDLGLLALKRKKLEFLKGL